MRFWDILETFAPVLTQERDHQNKVNLKEVSKIQWAGGVGCRSY